MKTKLLLLFLVIILAVSQRTHAAFPVKHTLATNAAVLNTAEAMNIKASGYRLHKPSWFESHITNAILPYADMLKPVRRRSDTIGLLSMIFGILGLATLELGGFGFFLSIAAVVLGAIGMSRHERYSVTGFVLGVVVVVIALIVILLLASLSGAFFTI